MTLCLSGELTDGAQYFIGDELGPLQVWWLEDETLIDFSVTHTFVGKLVADGVVLFTTVDDFTGAAGSGTEDSGTPNLVKTWPIIGELNDIDASGPYLFQITATRTSDSRQRTAQIPFEMKRIY